MSSHRADSNGAYIPHDYSYAFSQDTHYIDPYGRHPPPYQPSHPQYPRLPLAPNPNLPNQWQPYAPPNATQPAAYRPHDNLPLATFSPYQYQPSAVASTKRKHDPSQTSADVADKRWKPIDSHPRQPLLPTSQHPGFSSSPISPKTWSGPVPHHLTQYHAGVPAPHQLNASPAPSAPQATGTAHSLSSAAAQPYHAVQHKYATSPKDSNTVHPSNSQPARQHHLIGANNTINPQTPVEQSLTKPPQRTTDRAQQNMGTQQNPVNIDSSPELPRVILQPKQPKQKTYHAVLVGLNPGIYTDQMKAWSQVDGFRGAKHASFDTKEEAKAWYKAERKKLKGLADSEQTHNTHLQSVAPVERRVPERPTPQMIPEGTRPGYQWDPPLASRPTVPEPYIAHREPVHEPSHWTPSQVPASSAAVCADVVPIAEPTLCPEQADLVNLILSRRNVFYTGSAGCGKSTVLKAFVKVFTERQLKVHIVAPTGRAALDINGSTTWTYAGWTPDHHKKSIDELTKAAHGKFVSKRMRETDVLVIDEISMVENLHFERLNEVMKAARGSGLAFGGVQLVVTGDFCQLPPVKPFGHCITCGRELIRQNEGKEYRCRDHGIYYDIDKWAFRSNAWEECKFQHVNLTTIHRQSDIVFIDILNKLRLGTPLSMQDRTTLLDHKHSTRNAIVLFPTRAEVKRVNDEKFNKLRTQARAYHCLDHFSWNESHGNLESKKRVSFDGRSLQALADHRYEASMQLKKGMLVVLLHNLDIGQGLVNGSQGTIQGFEDYDEKKLPKAAARMDDKEKAPDMSRQGLTGDYATFRENQVKEFMKDAPFKKWPIVTFLNGVTRTIYADCTVNELGDSQPYSLLSRTQIPLMAAWAMTTHKSQGMTLNRVRVDLAKAFEEGQAYVALSRARSLDGLEVIALPPANKMGTGNPQVKEFLHEKFGL